MNRIIRQATLGFLLAAFPAGVALAAVFFEQDFESFDVNAVTNNDAQQAIFQFALPPIFAKQFGPGSLYELTDAASHSGNYSLQYNYDGNNGFCNTCGWKPGQQHYDHDGVTYFVDKLGRDLTAKEDPDTAKLSDGPAAEINKELFNASNGYSMWRITGIFSENATRDRLNLELVIPPIDGSAPLFRANDDVRITRRCGYDGIVANNVDRRSDCDGGIMWFGEASHNNAMSHAGPRTPLYRRVYLKPDVTVPLLHTKLRYVSYYENSIIPAGGIVVVAEAGLKTNSNPDIPDIRLAVSSLHLLPHKSPEPLDKIHRSGLNMPDFVLQRGKWYYLEEEIRPESSDGAKDGVYRLWVAEAGKEPVGCSTVPMDTDGDLVPDGDGDLMLEFTDLGIPPLRQSSLWGNNQHSVDSSGRWYVDDFRASDRCNGPVPAGSNPKDSMKPPAPPKNVKVS